VAETAGPVSGVADRYAAALFELALDAKAEDAVMADLQAFLALVDESADLARLVRSPVFTPDERLRALGAVLEAAGIGGLAGNFLRLAAKNRRLYAIPDMITGYRRRLAAHRGETSAEVVSAEPLSAAQAKALQEALNAVTGKSVSVSAKVDPSLIGGLVVKLGSHMIDSSLKTKLGSLRLALKEVG
jgi:F-type H+-transporting ATPase subunit delta